MKHQRTFPHFKINTANFITNKAKHIFFNIKTHVFKNVLNFFKMWMVFYRKKLIPLMLKGFSFIVIFFRLENTSSSSKKMCVRQGLLFLLNQKEKAKENRRILVETYGVNVLMQYRGPNEDNDQHWIDLVFTRNAGTHTALIKLDAIRIPRLFIYTSRTLYEILQQ